MRAASKLVGFALALLAVFGAGFGAGTAVGPLGPQGNEQGRVGEPHDMPGMEVTR